MKSKEEEYRELFLTEALENFEEMNRLFINLENDYSNKKVIANIFRIIHTLKGNALGMGYEKIADLAHTMEDIFGAIKDDRVALDSELVDSLFRANDKLGGLINALKTGETVSYLGIKTKLAIYLKNALEGEENKAEENQNTEEVKESSGSDQVNVQPQVLEEEEKDSSDNVEASPSMAFADVVQIPVRKMDDLLNMVGELVIERDRLISLFGDQGMSTLEFEGLKRISANLHYGIMSARMVQMGFLFNKFHRVLRDAAVSEKKDVKLTLKGTEVEIDRNILKIISDSLVHLVRNAVSHGIELPDDRKKAKKPVQATVTLEANLEKDNVVLSITDDGRGINVSKIKEKIVSQKMVTQEVADKLSEQDVIRYIFEPGFSVADKVTEISGRGVGMDVVKRSVESIGGQVLVETQMGVGSSFHLVLPSSLALKGALLFVVDEQEYAIPLSYIQSVNYYTKEEIHNIGTNLMVDYNNQSVSLIFLEYLFKERDLKNIAGSTLFKDRLASLGEKDQLNVIMTKHSGRKLGLVVDRLLRQKEIIEKKLPKPLDSCKILSGSTILGSGSVCPVVDVASIMDVFFKSAAKI